MTNIVVAAMYRFVRLDDYQALRQPLLETMQKLDVRGTLLLASEGLNGTVSGTRPAIDSLLDWLRKDPRFADIEVKESWLEEHPFYRTKVKLKKEIVTMGVDGIDPNKSVGTYVKPEDWNALIDDPNTILIDTRNEYEYQIGSFKNAINPHTDTFREFPAYVEQNLLNHKDKNIAMFCTGGIRCEKSTALLKGMGFDNVFHLRGGILKYLEDIPQEASMWEGECFVFDNRVAVNHDLEPGQYDQCYACRRPITEQEKQDARYQQGVSCHHCFDEYSESDRARFAERQKQIKLAKQRGNAHIGESAHQQIQSRRAQKQSHKDKQRGLTPEN